MGSDSDETLSDELERSDSEDDDSLVEEFRQRVQWTIGNGKYLIKLITDQTNIYGKQRCVEKGEDAKNWKEINENQTHAFLGLLFIMRFHKLPRIRDYWSQDRNLFTPAVANTMTRNEFQRLFSNIHLADNSNMPSKNSSNYNK
ncbi:unnamed protein product, partial [Rotaria socialis]